MKKMLLLLTAFTLCACHKQQIPLAGITPTPVPTKGPDSNATLFVGGGQSQMSQETNLKETFPNSVNFGIGGSPLSSWQRGTPSYQKVIDACKNRAVPCVLLFWQGEAETTDMALANTWGQQFLVMVDSLRQDLHSEIKVVYVQIGNVIDNTNDPGMPSPLSALFPYWQTVKDQQNQVNHTRHNLEMVKSDDMNPASGDGIHYTLPQYKTVQARMMTAWQGMAE